MTRTELKGRWETYCRDYVPRQPDGFSQENYLFDSKDVAISVELSRQMKPSDHLVELGFHVPDADRGLGPTERSRETLAELTEFLRRDCKRMAFGCEFGKCDDIHVVRDPKSIVDRDIWFIGDIHGDLLALRTTVAFVASNSVHKPVYVFLGDFFDRNPFGLNVLIEVVGLLKKDPDSVFLLPGNHDDGLQWAESGVSSRITPHQFSDEMNAFANSVAKEFVEEYIRLVSRLPVGLLLPNGAFVSHGGVPSRPGREVKNIWENLDGKEIKRLIREQRSQFLCNRFQKDAKTKIAPDFSWAELVNFSEAMETAYGISVKSMVRGHDHCDLCRHDWAHSTFEGSEFCSAEKAERVRDVLTMTSMFMMYEESRLPGFLQHETSFPTVAHYRADTVVPEVHTIRINSRDVLAYVEVGKTSIEFEHAEIVASRKSEFESQRAELRRKQEDVVSKIKAAELAKADVDQKIEKSKKSYSAWTSQVSTLKARKIPDSKEICRLVAKLTELQKELEAMRREKSLKVQPRAEERATTRLDDLKDGVRSLIEKGKSLISKSEEEYVLEIGEIQKEIERMREGARESDPCLIDARKNSASAASALSANNAALQEKEKEIASLMSQQGELIAQLNAIQKDIENCKAAEMLLKKGGK